MDLAAGLDTTGGQGAVFFCDDHTVHLFDAFPMPGDTVSDSERSIAGSSGGQSLAGPVPTIAGTGLLMIEIAVSPFVITTSSMWSAPVDVFGPPDVQIVSLPNQLFIGAPIGDVDRDGALD
jgi:hypothetical protein